MYLQLDDQLGSAAHRVGQVQQHVAPLCAQRQPVRERPPAVAAHRAVLSVDGDQFGGRFGGRPGARQHERGVTARCSDQVGGERGQRVDGAGGQRRVQPLVELGRVEPAVGDGRAQQFGDPVTVRVGRAKCGRAGRIRRHPASSGWARRRHGGTAPPAFHVIALLILRS
jgi:hypothetical protein